MPLSPRTMMEIASVTVMPTSAIGPMPWAARLRTHSAPARVLPAPRPPSSSQVVQSPSGGRCLSSAHRFQSKYISQVPSGLLRRASSCAGVGPRSSSRKPRASAISELLNALGQLVAEVRHVIHAWRLRIGLGRPHLDQLVERLGLQAQHGGLFLDRFIHGHFQSPCLFVEYL